MKGRLFANAVGLHRSHFGRLAVSMLSFLVMLFGAPLCPLPPDVPPEAESPAHGPPQLSRSLSFPDSYASSIPTAPQPGWSGGTTRDSRVFSNVSEIVAPSQLARVMCCPVRIRVGFLKGSLPATFRAWLNDREITGKLMVNASGAEGWVTQEDGLRVPRTGGVHSPAKPNLLLTVIRGTEGREDVDARLFFVTRSTGENHPPQADAGPDQTRRVAETAYLDGSGSSDPDGDPLTHAWSFVEKPLGSAATLSDPTVVRPSFFVDKAGRYILSLVVNDGALDSTADTVVVTTENSPPVANAGPDSTVDVGSIATLDGSRSSDVDGDPLTFRWSFLSVPNGSDTLLEGGSTASPSFFVDEPGNYTLSLVVHDGHVESAPDTVVVTTHNSPPVANAGPDRTVHVGSLVTLDGSGSSDVDGDPLTYRWSLTAKPPGSGAQLSDPTAQAPSFEADALGDYVGQLIVHDGQTDSAPDTVVVTTDNSKPVANPGSDRTVLEGETVALDGSASYDADHDTLTHAWSFTTRPEGSLAVLSDPAAANPTFTVDQAGIYTVQLIVSDGYMQSDPAIVRITVQPATIPIPDVTGMPREQAEVALAASGLLVGPATLVHSDSVPAGHVVRTVPPAGAPVAPGSDVSLVVSLGPETIVVPDVVGMALADAEAVLTGAGLSVGSITQAHHPTIPADHVFSQDPAAGASVTLGSAINLGVSLGPRTASVPSVVGITQAEAETALAQALLTVGVVTLQNDDRVPEGRVISQSPAAGASVAVGSAVSLVVSLGPAGGLPPDPRTVAPPVDPTVATTMVSAVRFLYSGASPIQTGVAPGVIEPKRVAVLRGRVLDRDSAPLPGVSISVHGHPEFGGTLSRADGMFDLAVNGGGPLTVNYSKHGILPAQRKVDVPWQEYVRVPDVVLIALDAQTTLVDLTAAEPMQVARGSAMTDSDGTRQPTLLVPQGTLAELVMPDGSTQALSALTVRATEYTVGPTGPKAMPGLLPPTSAYTYAVELSADEALSAGARSLRFNQPMLHYVENFLGFPTGSAVPVGYYDRERAAWIPSNNGRVIQIVSIAGGLAALDTDGDGQVDNGAALGVTDAERQQLASLYGAGQSLWRVPIPHFSPWDCNWPFGLPDGAGPGGGPPRGGGSGGSGGGGGGGGGSGGGGGGTGGCTGPNCDEEDTEDESDKCGNQCCEEGSVIGCQSQTLGESVPIVGTSFRLHYESDRVPGASTENVLAIPISGAELPPGLRRIDLEIHVAGRRFTESFPAVPNQGTVFTWDGEDEYGHRLQGYHPYRVRVGYVYNAVYRTPAENDQAFAQYGEALLPNPNREEIALWREWQGFLGKWDARPQTMAGWSLNVHHSYDPAGQTLYLGNGGRRAGAGLPKVITRAAGGGAVNQRGDGGPATAAWLFQAVDIAFGPDGSYYIADQADNRIRRVDPEGIITTFAGTGSAGFLGDSGPATAARLWSPKGVAVGPEGGVYILDSANYRVRRVGPDGIITTVAGNGEYCDEYSVACGDGVPALEARLGDVHGIAVDRDGNCYVTQNVFGGRWIRRIDANGILTTIAVGDVGDDFRGMAVGPDGSLFVVSGNAVRKVGPDGVLSTIAGNVDWPCYSWNRPCGDGGPATEARMTYPQDVAVGPDGSFAIAVLQDNKIREVTPDGIIRTVAGNGNPNYGGDNGDNGPATAAVVNQPRAVAIGPDRSLYLVDTYPPQTIRRVAAPLPGLSFDDILVPSSSGRLLYHFDYSGRHLRTLDALTGAVRHAFAYDASGRLESITDADGNITTIERDASGSPQAIVAPFGQRTVLAVDANGFLSRITNPAGEITEFGSDPNGLMTRRTDPRGSTFEMRYDELGRLIRDADPAGGSKTLTRTEGGQNHTVTMTTALGRTTSYRVEQPVEGGQRQINTFPSGLQAEQILGSDGAVSTRFVDGTRATHRYGADPRWGMMAPVESGSSLRTPGGRTLSVEASRSVTLSDPNNLLSLVSATDTLRVNGRPYTGTYDATTRTFTVRTPTGRQASETLDAVGRVARSQVAGLAAVQYAYDARGRLAAAAMGEGPDTRTLAFSYNADGTLETLTDPLGRTRSFQYDPAGRLSQLTQPDGRVIQATFDANGNLATLTPPDRPPHAFVHTAADLPSEYLPPDVDAAADRTLYTHDVDRQLTGIARPDGQGITVEYDTAGRPFRLTQPRGQSVYGYSATTGHLTSATAPGGLGLSFTYDGLLPTGETYVGEVAGSVTRTYNNDLLMATQSINGGSSISFTYDADGLLTQAGGLTLARNAQNGLLTGAALGILTETWTYNAFGERTGATVTAGGTSLLAQQLTRDFLGRITEKAETIGGVTQTFTYTYDLAGRLTEVRQGGVLTAAYTYDANGNRLTGPVDTTTYSYDDQDRLTQWSTPNPPSTTTYSHSAHGERVSKTAGGLNTVYDYDALGNLMGVTLPGGTRIDYLVDARNRRIGKKVNGVRVQGFLYDGQVRPVAELDGGGAVVARFVYATRENVPDYMIKGGGAYRIVTDPLGSPRLVVNAATGDTVQRMDYDAFGRVTGDTNPGFQPFGFAGGLYDPQTQLVRFGARDYDPETGRWTAKDPILFAGGDPNLYAYVGNDPVNRMDATGTVPGAPQQPFWLGPDWVNKGKITVEHAARLWEKYWGEWGSKAAARLREDLIRGIAQNVCKGIYPVMTLFPFQDAEGMPDVGEFMRWIRGFRWNPLTGAFDQPPMS